MRVDQVLDAEAIRLESRVARRRISELENKQILDEVDTLISVAEGVVDRMLIKLRRVRP